MTAFRGLRWAVAIPFRLLGWIAVLFGEVGYWAGEKLGTIANLIEGNS